MKLSKNKETVQRQIDRLQDHLDSLYAADAPTQSRSGICFSPAIMKASVDSFRNQISVIGDMQRALSEPKGKTVSVRMPVRFV